MVDIFKDPSIFGQLKQLLYSGGMCVLHSIDCNVITYHIDLHRGDPYNDVITYSFKMPVAESFIKPLYRTVEPKDLMHWIKQAIMQNRLNVVGASKQTTLYNSDEI